MYLDNYITEIRKLCQQNSVRRLYAFGSVLTDRFNDKSDVDFLVDIEGENALERGEKYFNVLFALQDMLNRNVDLLEEKAIRNKYLKFEIDRTKQVLYAG
jgi:predicted nucleotidyltransferase